MAYNWQLPDWPKFTYNIDEVLDLILSCTERIGRLSGMLGAANAEVDREVNIASLLAETLKTSAIEGEYIHRDDLMSSIRNNLGLNTKPEIVRDKRAGGVVRMMLHVRKTFDSALSEKEMCTWHSLLMEGNQYVKAGVWRASSEPMQVVSGAAGREKVHFEAPPSSRVPQEMKAFIEWFNDTAPGGKHAMVHAPLRSALAHLYFESIHPFEDGNGRIGRALSEKALSQYAGNPIIISLSQVIEANEKAYYSALKKGQQSNEVSPWLQYFIGVIDQALRQAEEQIAFTIRKMRFFDNLKDQLNPRQLKVLRKMWEQGPGSFEGGMSAKKYMGITGTSKATATRDLQELSDEGILHPEGEGRSRRYILREC